MEEKFLQRFRYKLHEIIFEADTRAGKLFDVFLIISIVLSVFMVMLDSVGSIRAAHGSFLYFGEWFFTYLWEIKYYRKTVLDTYLLINTLYK